MYRFYTDKENIISDKEIIINGTDVNHIKNVLRMRDGDRIIVNDTDGTDCYCVITDISRDEITLKIENTKKCEAELKSKLYLFQALPKLDKMEFIIQKAVELGAHEIIPMVTKRCVMKLDGDKRQEKKLSRWRAISEAAAKQSSRGVIPEVKDPMTFTEALKYAEKNGYNIIPYEHAEGMDMARHIIKEAAGSDSVGIFIGPEGGFEEEEIRMAEEFGIKTISLGNRILRTETAGMTVLSILMFQISE